MTEKEFWSFLNTKLAKGRIPMVSGRSDSDDMEIQQAGEFISGHGLLPKDYDKIPKDKIADMGKLLLEKNVSFETKQAIMIILAHHLSGEALSALRGYYNARPDERLRIFAKLALDECEMWNEE